MRYLLLIGLILFSSNSLFAQDDEVMEAMIVEKLPKYEGCEDLEGEEARICSETKVIEFLVKNVRYPKEAIDAGITGTVYLYYEVDLEGNVVNVEVLRGVSEELDAEAVRVLSMLPQFTPGEQRGKAVRVRYTIPVKFSFADDKAEKKSKRKKKKG